MVKAQKRHYEDKTRADKLNEFLYTVNAEEFRKFSHQKMCFFPTTQTRFFKKISGISMVLHSAEFQKHFTNRFIMTREYLSKILEGIEAGNNKCSV